VRADENLTAFLELESAIRGRKLNLALRGRFISNSLSQRGKDRGKSCRDGAALIFARAHFRKCCCKLVIALGWRLRCSAWLGLFLLPLGAAHPVKARNAPHFISPLHPCDQIKAELRKMKFVPH
jgi:hypothetical protein